MHHAHTSSPRLSINFAMPNFVDGTVSYLPAGVTQRLGARWLLEHGFDPDAPGCEFDVLRARMRESS